MSLNHRDIVWSSEEAAIVTGGVNSTDWHATGISMNINDIRAGDLFVASAQDDLDEVFRKGAAAVMVSRGVACDHPALPVLCVPGTYEALQGLARAARFRTHAHVVAVQGKEARLRVQTLLGQVGSVHTGGRHLSLGLAGLPVYADYGVFGASPAVQPDIAMITDPEQANRDTLFEHIAPQGSVLIHAQGEAHIAVVARAKAAGVQNIYTYGGDALHTDARIISKVQADNGLRVCANIAGEDYNFFLKGMQVFDENLLAALLVLKINDQCLVSALERLSVVEASSVAKEGLSLIDEVQACPDQAAFRITNMIDFGFGQQTAVLDNIAKLAKNGAKQSMGASHKLGLSLKKGFAIPVKLANLNFVYTTKGAGTVQNARAVIEKKHRGAVIESIPTDVLAPGDFLVFKDVWDSSKSALSEALRIIPEGKRKSRHVI